MTRVLICDDQEVVCEGLRAILSSVDEIEVVGIAHDGNAALELIPQVNPEVILMDLKMPGMNGIHASRQIRDIFPQIKILVLTTYDADEWVLDAIRSGAAGYLLKDTPRDELITVIKGTMAGNNYVDPAVAGKLFANISQNPPPSTSIAETLSDRELEVLRLLGRGLSNNEIARQLFLSEGTIRNYVSSLFTKLGVTDRTQAAVLAIRYGLVDLA